jgi:hypothetical protein
VICCRWQSDFAREASILWIDDEDEDEAFAEADREEAAVLRAQNMIDGNGPIPSVRTPRGSSVDVQKAAFWLEYSDMLFPEGDSGTGNSSRVFLEAMQKLQTVPLNLLVRKGVEGRLQLQHYGVSDRMAIALSSALGRMTFGSTLILRNNLIGAVGCGAIASQLNMAQLTTLDLSNNHLNSVLPDGFAALLNAIRENETLTSLGLGGNKLTTKCFNELASSIHGKMQLRKLNVSRNNMNDEACSILVRALQHTSVECVDFSWNALHGCSIAALLTATETRLHSLDLAHNGLGRGHGVSELFSALVTNKTLTALDVSYNRLNQHWILFLASMLASNTVLIDLRVNGNFVGFHGGRALLRAETMSDGKKREVAMFMCQLDEMSTKLRFDPADPNGRYKLDLSDDLDRSIAMQLVLISREEKTGLLNWHNATMNKHPIHGHIDAHFVPPVSGILELDFVQPSHLRAPATTEAFKNVFEAIKDMKSNDPNKGRTMIRIAARENDFAVNQVSDIVAIHRN